MTRPPPSRGGAGARLAPPPTRPVSWWWWVLAVDAGFVAFGLLRGWLPHTPLFEALRSHLGLEHEMNLPAWWAGAQLFVAGALMYEVACVHQRDARWPWRILAGLAVALSYDEVASVHERLGMHGWGPLVPIGAVAVAALGWALLRLAGRHGRRRAAGLVLLAFGLFGTVVVQEELEARLDWSGLLPTRLVTEEGTELLGFLLLLLAAAGERAGGEPGLRAVIPRPDRLRVLPTLLLAGLVANALVSVLLVPALSDLHGRGNPAVWYPSAVYGLLASAAGWAAHAAEGAGRRWWGGLAGFLLLCSVGAVFDLVHLAPGIHLILPRWSYHGFYATYLCLVPVVLGLGAGALAPRRGPLLGVGAGLAALLALRLGVAEWRIDAVTPSLVAYLWTLVFLPRAGVDPPPR